MKKLFGTKNTLRENTFPMNLFLILSGLSFLCVIILAALSEGGALNDIFYGSDYFNDFYNSMCDAGTKGVYAEKGVIYPPLSSLFFYLISKMVPNMYVMLDFETGDRHQIYTSGLCQIIFLLFIVVTALALGMLFYDILQRTASKIGSFLTSFFLMMSFPILYCIQRGNVALLAMLLTAFFVFYRNSDNKVLREISYIALAVAAGFKIFPALFGLLLIFDKKYKEAARLVVYGLLAFFVPFAFYGGFEGISIFIKNIFSFSEESSYYSIYGPSITNVLSWLIFGLKLDLGSLMNFSQIAVWLCCAFIMFFADEEWKRLLGISFLFANVNSTSRVYILIFILLPFISFILSRPSGKKSVLYSILFCSLLVTIPCFWYFRMDSITVALHNGLGIDVNTINLLKKGNVMTEPFIVLLFEIILVIDTAGSLKHKKIKHD